MRKILVMMAACGTLACAACGQKSAQAEAAACEGVATVALPNAKVTSAQHVAAGSFTPMTRRPDASKACRATSMTCSNDGMSLISGTRTRS